MIEMAQEVGIAVGRCSGDPLATMLVDNYSQAELQLQLQLS